MVSITGHVRYPPSKAQVRTQERERKDAEAVECALLVIDAIQTELRAGFQREVPRLAKTWSELPPILLKNLTVKKRKGRPQENVVRNMLIAFTVAYLNKLKGYPLEAAYSIVQRTLAQRGVHLSKKGVEQAYLPYAQFWRLSSEKRQLRLNEGWPLKSPLHETEVRKYFFSPAKPDGQTSKVPIPAPDCRSESSGLDALQYLPTRLRRVSRSRSKRMGRRGDDESITPRRKRGFLPQNNKRRVVEDTR